MVATARFRVVGLVVALACASFTAWSATAESDTGPLFEHVETRAGWMLVKATVSGNGWLDVRLEGDDGQAPYVAGIYVLDPAGNPLAGGLSAYDGKEGASATYGDAHAFDLTVPILPVGDGATPTQAPAASARVEGGGSALQTFQILAYGGGAGDPLLTFTVDGEGIQNPQITTGPASFWTESEFNPVWARADSGADAAAAASALGAVSEEVSHELFGYFGPVASVAADCQGTCVTDETTTALVVDRNGGDPMVGGSLTFFGETPGLWTFRNVAHAGVQGPGSFGTCVIKPCPSVDVSASPRIVLLVADVQL